MRRSTRLSNRTAAADGQPRVLVSDGDENGSEELHDSINQSMDAPATKRKADKMTKATSRSGVSDDSAYEIEDLCPEKKYKAPAKKKASKEKNTSWLDLAKPSTASFDHVPIEILDLIISVDSDLGLRDHLSLAGTCRFFRACYHDLVWQVLLQAHAPRACIDPYEIQITRVTQNIRRLRPHWPTDPISIDTYVDRAQPFGPRMAGPFTRSFRHARHIFSNGPNGAPGSERWGQSCAEWEAGELERDELVWATREAVVNDPKMPRSYDSVLETTVVADGIFHFEIFDEPTDKELRRAEQLTSFEQFRQRSELFAKFSHRLSPTAETDQTWPSLWRHLVSLAVDRPTLTKKDAKERFRVSDSDLRTLPLMKTDDKPYEGRRSELPKTGGYRLSQVEALALRTHQGPEGLKGHLQILAQKRRRAEERKKARKAAQQQAQSGEASTSTGASISALDVVAPELDEDNEMDPPDNWPANEVEDGLDGMTDDL